jgi:hypothetical protein
MLGGRSEVRVIFLALLLAFPGCNAACLGLAVGLGANASSNYKAKAEMEQYRAACQARDQVACIDYEDALARRRDRMMAARMGARRSASSTPRPITPAPPVITTCNDFGDTVNCVSR